MIQLLFAALLALGAGWAPAAERTDTQKNASAQQPGVRRFVSRHQGTFAGRKISYEVIAADTTVRNVAGDAIGSMFSFSYLEDGASASRPVTFVFNGGPGSSSLWLHLGIGPKRVALSDPKPKVTPPYLLVDNPDSPLAVSDLVFIDPIGTGFSQILGKGAAADFYGNNQDARSVTQFIERWLDEHRRWNSPKFLMGESYGTVRASLLTALLMGGSDNVAVRGIALNGLMMVGHDGGIVPLDSEARFQTNFTTMAASAWYHNRVERGGRSFEQFIDAARTFSTQDLAPALANGRLSTAELARLSESMAAFIGLSPGYIRQHNLRISAVNFSRALLGEQGIDVGLFDARFTLPKKAATDAIGLGGEGVGNATDDPVLSLVTPPFVGAFRTYLWKDLGVVVDQPYIALADLESQWKDSGPRVEPGSALVNAMRRNPELQVMFLGGWFDVLTGAIGAAEYAIEKRLPRDRTTVKSYASGHMCYIGDAASAVGRDVIAFIDKAVADDQSVKK